MLLLGLPVQSFQLHTPPIQVGLVQFDDPFQNNYAPPPPPLPMAILSQNNYHHLPTHLAQAVAQLPPLQPQHCGCPRHQMDLLVTMFLFFGMLCCLNLFFLNKALSPALLPVPNLPQPVYNTPNLQIVRI